MKTALKKIETPVSEITLYDIVIPLTIFAQVIVRNAMYSDIVYDVYSGKKFPGLWTWYVLILRCAITRSGQGENPKPFFRNALFNVLKHLFPMTWVPLMITGLGYDSPNLIFMTTLKIVIATAVLQYLVPWRRFFRDNRYLWIWLFIEVQMCKPFFLVQSMNSWHKNLDGDLVMIVFALWCNIMNREFGTVLEDMVYGDQNTNILYNPHKIPPVYSCYIFSFLVIYYF